MLEKAIRLREARRAVRKGHLAEALRVLQSAPLAGHRDALDLRDRVYRELLTRAGTSLDNADLAAARHALKILGSAHHESDEFERLRGRLAAAEQRRGVEEQARENILRAAHKQLDTGSLSGVREKLESLESDSSDVQAMKAWVEARSRDLDRYLTRCRSAIQARDLSNAKSHQNRAEQLFPTHPDVRRLADAVTKLEQDLAREALQRACRSHAGEQAWSTYLETTRRHPPLRDHPEFERFRARYVAQQDRAARAALHRGDLDQAVLAIHPLLADLADPDPSLSSLITVVYQWKRAREARAAGELRRAKALYQEALERLGPTKTLRRELQDVETSIVIRDRHLEQIEKALESGDLQESSRLISTAIEDGAAPGWLSPLRREVRSRLDAGSTALNEAQKLLAAGKTREARVSLIPLLSRPEIRQQALIMWKEIDARERKAAQLIGHAEALTLGLTSETNDLIEALRIVDEALDRQADHPRGTDLRTLIENRKFAQEKLEEARILAHAGQLERALACCQEGERADPTNPTLTTFSHRIRYRRTREILEEAEALITRDRLDEARRLLAVAQGYPDLDPESSHQIRYLLTRCANEAPELDPGRSTPAAAAPSSHTSASDPMLPPRFMLHVEEGPEALVLTEGLIRIGNARDVDNQIALMANVSSCHATLQRETSFHGGVIYRLRAGEGKECRVHDRPVRNYVLQDGDDVEIGREVVFRFRLPDPGSSTALIQITRGYHVDDIKNILLMKGPGSDGRIRMAPTPSSHLACSKFDRIVDLYLDCPPDPGPDALHVETQGVIEVDGVKHEDRACVALGSYVRCGPCRLQIGRAS